MKEPEVETVVQRAYEQRPNEHPRINTDNARQFLARDFDDSSLNHIEGAWLEDRSTRGCELSADPGAKTGAIGTMPPHALAGLARMR